MDRERRTPQSMLGGRSLSRRRSSGRSPCSPNGSATSSRRNSTCSVLPIAETVFEGGRRSHYERGVDGSECRWARVFVYEPPDPCRIQLGHQRGVEIVTNPEKTSEVEVRSSPRRRNAPR